MIALRAETRRLQAIQAVSGYGQLEYSCTAPHLVADDVPSLRLRESKLPLLDEVVQL